MSPRMIPFDERGGEATVQALVERFHDRMDRAEPARFSEVADSMRNRPG